MSYNISSWTTKKIVGLCIPISSFELSEDMKKRGWRAPTVSDVWFDFEKKEIHATLEKMESTIRGVIESDLWWVEVDYINIRGEGSGTLFNEFLIPALGNSRGILEAVLVWEGGDYICRLVAEDGVVEETAIKL